MFGIEIRQFKRGRDPVPHYIVFKTAGLHPCFHKWLKDLGPICEVEEKTIHAPKSKPLLTNKHW